MNKIMKTKYFFLMAMAAMMMAATPASSLRAEETADSTKNAGVSVKLSGMTVNGKPATAQQKAVAKKMTRQGAQMAKKGMQLAMSAVTNPDKAEKLGDELEQMGEEMERLGDSLETLAEDTTFFYEGEDSDEVELLSESDLDEISRDFSENFGWLDSWWGKLLGGGLGIMGGILGILIAIFVVVLLFALFTSPIWVLALIIWLIVRGSRTNPTTTYQNPPMGGAQAAGHAQPLAGSANAGEGTYSSQMTAGGNATLSRRERRDVEEWYHVVVRGRRSHPRLPWNRLRRSVGHRCPGGLHRSGQAGDCHDHEEEATADVRPLEVSGGGGE